MSLGLLGAYVSGSESESESESHSGLEEDKKDVKLLIAKTEPGPPEVLANPFSSGGRLLPQPSFLQESEKIAGVKFNSSVFSNPFRDKEDRKKAILEQHVNMTQKQEEMRVIDGKKVCWMYRKGRCRHGHKCTFAHDTDVKTARGGQQAEPRYDADSQITSREKAPGGSGPVIQLAAAPRELTPPREEEEDPVQRKKRPGLSQGLVPSKKAMQFHNKVYHATQP